MDFSAFMPLPEPQQATCVGCRNPFLRSYPIVRYCEPCRLTRERLDAKAREERAIAQRLVLWEESICPKQYQQTELSKLPRLDLYDRVQAWSYGERGLILHGSTGLGKSRAAWALCRREFIAGRTLRVISPAVMLRIPGWCGSGDMDAKFRQYSAADLVLMDDAFKSRLSPSAEEFVCALVEERTSRGRPLILTLNDTGERLIERMSEDRGAPLLRRLREFCDAISFTVRTQPKQK